MRAPILSIVAISCLFGGTREVPAADYEVTEGEETIRIVTPQLEAAVRKKGYVSGVAAQSMLDKKTGFRDPGFGLDIVDWIMEPGSEPVPRQSGEAVDRGAADLHPGPRASSGDHPRQGLRRRPAVVQVP